MGNQLHVTISWRVTENLEIENVVTTPPTQGKTFLIKEYAIANNVKLVPGDYSFTIPAGHPQHHPVVPESLKGKTREWLIKSFEEAFEPVTDELEIATTEFPSDALLRGAIIVAIEYAFRQILRKELEERFEKTSRSLHKPIVLPPDCFLVLPVSANRAHAKLKVGEEWFRARMSRAKSEEEAQHIATESLETLPCFTFGRAICSIDRDDKTITFRVGYLNEHNTVFGAWFNERLADRFDTLLKRTKHRAIHRVVRLLQKEAMITRSFAQSLSEMFVCGPK